jgi:succinoglycan biosynthesis protein ExoM
MDVDREGRRVDVCICTFRRTSVADTIKSVAAQSYGSGHLRLIIADNDAENSAQEVIESIGRLAGVDLLYIHAPKENISIARNACVDAVTAPRFAFIDDDEVADPNWLETLVDAMDQEGADVVFGPVDAVYDPSVPPWWTRSGLHNTRPTILPNGAIVTGYTCNVLIRTRSLQGLRFRLDFGKSGGEDTLFFRDLHCRGGRFAYAPGARVQELVAAKRLRLKWLLARSFLGGQLHMSICILDRRPLAPIILMSMIKGAATSCGPACTSASWRGCWAIAKSCARTVRIRRK